MPLFFFFIHMLMTITLGTEKDFGTNKHLSCMPCLVIRWFWFCSCLIWNNYSKNSVVIYRLLVLCCAAQRHVQPSYGRLPKPLLRFDPFFEEILQCTSYFSEISRLVTFSFYVQAAEKLRITAPELVRLQVADGVIPVIIHFPLFFKIFVFAMLLHMSHATSPKKNEKVKKRKATASCAAFIIKQTI